MTFDAEEVPGEVGTWSGALSGLAGDCLAALPGFGVILSVFFVFGIPRGYRRPGGRIKPERVRKRTPRLATIDAARAENANENETGRARIL